MFTGYVYKLVCSDVNIRECYVGSTKNMTRGSVYIKVLVISKIPPNIILRFISLSETTVDSLHGK